MKVTDFYNEVAKRADTDKTQINVAETRRVLSQGFQVLVGLSTEECADTIAKLLAAAAKAAAKGK